MPKGLRIRLAGGINLSDPASELETGELTIARNCHYLPESSRLVKVNGRSLFGAMGSTATGLSFVKFRSGDAYLVGAAGTSYYTAPVATTGTWTASATSLSSVGRMEAVYYNGTDRVYVADGTNTLKVWTGSGTMRDAGLLTPLTGAIEFISNSATSYSSGVTFYYCHTEYDSVNDVESPPSPVVQAAASAASGTFKYTLPAMTNSSADTVRLYRTQHGSGVFYMLAEFTDDNLRYYDGSDTEGLAGTDTGNLDQWGFLTVDDGFLSTRPVLPMVGEPLRGNYVTANGAIPKGDIIGIFENSLYVSGVTAYPQDIYYSMPDFPEMFSPVNFLREENARGDPVTGCGVANDRFIAFTLNSIFRHNTFPRPTDPGFGIGVANRELVTSDHGCIAKRTVVNFGVGQPNNRLFYLSTRGPMMTDGYETVPLNEDLDWSERIVNIGAVTNAVAMNYPKYQQIWLYVPSPNSSTNDVAWVYHYHPNHLKKGAVGKWTGPVHVRCAAAAVSYDAVTETRMFVADTTSAGDVFLEDSGNVDGQFYDDSDGAIDWEWETGRLTLGEESAFKRVQRVFVNTLGSDEFQPEFTFSLNQNAPRNNIYLAATTDGTPATTKIGTSLADTMPTRSFRGGVWQTAPMFQFRMRELAVAARSIVSIEPEVEEFGRQK